MLRREINIARNRPIPISMLIQTTNEFGCDILIECDHLSVNAKNYEDMKGHLKVRTPHLFFSFSGDDEVQADKRIEKLFS